MQVEIIVGSVLGASEYVADAVSELLNAHGHTTTLHLEPDLANIDQNQTWCVITSTHGAGELPENIQNFAQQLTEITLSNKCIVIGLGDTSYDTFCQGSIIIQERLQTAGSTLITEPLHIDVIHHPVPEEFALEWLESKLELL